MDPAIDYHKDANRYKFESFTERIASISVDVIRRHPQADQIDQAEDSYFVAGLAKWSELNCSQDFDKFAKAVKFNIRNYAQLVHNEAEIVSLLKTHLRVKPSLAHLPLLDLVVQITRDLQKDMYPHFREFFTIIIDLLDTQDTELIEGAFQTLGYLFKYLWRHLVKDIEQVYSFYSVLLSGDKKEHILRFASESFAFLLRKVKSKDEFFDYIFTDLVDKPERVAGVGRLIFEMVKSVRKQLHSCTKDVLKILLSKLRPQEKIDKDDRLVDSEQVHQCLETTLQLICRYVNEESVLVVWQTLLDDAATLHKELPGERNTEGARQNLSYILRLLELLVRFSHGKLLANPKQLNGFLLCVLSGGAIGAPCDGDILELLSALLLARHCQLSMEQAGNLTSNVFRDGRFSLEQILQFSRSVANMSDFEGVLLSKLLEFCHVRVSLASTRPEDKELILFTLVYLLQEKSSSDDEGAPTKLKVYPLDFSISVEKMKISAKKKKRKSGQEKRESFPEFLLSSLERFLRGDETLPFIWGVITCLPNVRPLDRRRSCDLLLEVINQLISSIEETTQEETQQLQMFMLCGTVQAFLYYGNMGEVASFEKTILELLRVHSNSEHALFIADCWYVKAISLSVPVDFEGLRQLFLSLVGNISSSNSKIRLLTLRILTHIPVILPEGKDTKANQVSVLRLCLNAEEVPLTFNTYRDKLMHLRKLEYEPVQRSLPTDLDCSQVALRYLVGTLHANLQLLWGPVIDLIKSHTYGMDKNTFWSVFRPFLVDATAQIKSLEPRVSNRRHSLPFPAATTTPDPGDLEGLLQESMLARMKSTDRPDLISFRNLLWKAMMTFPERVEMKTKDLVPMVLDFVNNEYNLVESALAPSQNILKDGGETGLDETGEEAEEEERPVKSKSVCSRAALQKSLVVYLQLFSKFRNPKAFFQEARMRELFFRLLSSPHTLIQKAALDCVMTYKFSYMQPYTDQFGALMEDKTFTDALLQFNIDEDSGLIGEQHREGLLPILFRILYGKMLSRSGPQGKSGVNYRRSIILRFLGGAREAEMRIFLDLIFEPFLDSMQASPSKMLKECLDTLNPSSVIPIKRQHSILETCSTLLSRVGHLIGSYNSTVLHILTVLAGSYNALLDRRDELLPHVVKQLKTLRQNVINRIEQFFNMYDEYPFSADEVESIFDAVVWPQLERLHNECLASPTPLLKMFHQWSKQPRLHILLAKHHPHNAELYAIPQCIALLSSTLAAPPVVSMVMEMIYNLLTLEMEEEEAPLSAENVVNMPKLTVSQQEGEVSFGVCLIHPYITQILQYLRNAVKPRRTKADLPMKEISLLSKGQRSSEVNRGEALKILDQSRLSGFVRDPAQSSSLISLLLPYLEKTREKHEEIEIDILNTMKNLVIFVEDSSQFINKLSKCFQRLTSRKSRRVLCDVITTMATKLPDLEEVARLVQDLNSWDRKRLDEPDFTKRIATFKLANQRVDASEVDTTFLSLIMDNSFYFILKVDEMSLRDNSSFCLVNFIRKSSSLNLNKGAVQNLVLSKYLPALKEGVKSRRESARHECIAILSEVIRHFPTLDVFSPLAVLHDADTEKDFFENIRHIQIHRRVRALKKLSKHCKQGQLEGTVVRNFLLPLATALVFDPVLGDKHEKIVLEAVDCVGAIAGVLPWGTYFALFKQFLRLLLNNPDQQKIAVRLLVAVLEAFHFDLSSSEYTGQGDPGPRRDITGNNSKTTEEGGQDQKSKDKTPEKLDQKTGVGVKEILDLDEGEGEDSGNEEEDGSKVSEEDEGSKVSSKDKATATRIHRTIMDSILPRLMEIFQERSRSDTQHKVTRDNSFDEAEIQRIPLAVALVKLVKQLPNNTLEVHLSSIVLKICNILKHRIMNVRDIARDSLVKILNSVGVAYFNNILHQMSGVLTRGYQVHVLGYTVYRLLRSFPGLKPGDLDQSLEELITILNGELFGVISEEKQVAAIMGKLPEAKGSKALDCYELIGKVVGEGSLTTLILPLKEMLETTHSYKVVNIVREALRRISIGLVSNTGISVESTMIFIHGLASDTLPLVTAFDKSKAALRPPPDPRLQPPSVYLLLPTPRRPGQSANMGRKTNMHVLMEFGLLLLHSSLKSSKLSHSEVLHLQMLDPFVDILTKALGAKANAVINVAVRCLTFMLRYPLPSLEGASEGITKALFQLLKKHAGAGTAKGDNLELVTNTFKAVTVLVRDIKHHDINEKQLQVLLAYCEEDMHDYTRQATAFSLLRAILSKKLVVPEIHDVVSKVRQLAITSETPSIRAQCRQVDLQYLLDYPLGKKIKVPLEFYVSQLEFQMESGRRSALDMLLSMFSAFPQKILLKFSGLFFVPMAVRLVNDESATCQRLVASSLKVLLGKLDSTKREEIFGMIKQWLSDREPGHQRLAIQLCGIFVEAEGAVDFSARLGYLLPVLEEKIRPEKWDTSVDETAVDDEKESDHLLFHLLSCLLKVIKTCGIVKTGDHRDTTNKLWSSMEEHLLHPHAWVRIITAQLYGELFAAWPTDELVTAVQEVEKEESGGTAESAPYIVSDGRSKAKFLVTKFCGQLLSSHLKKEHAHQILKNLIYLGKALHRVYPMRAGECLSISDVIANDDMTEDYDKTDESEPKESSTEEGDDGSKESPEIEGDSESSDDGEEESKQPLDGTEENDGQNKGVVSIVWMVRKLCWISSNESYKHTKVTLRRTCVIKWSAALALDMEPDDVRRCLPPIIRVLVRSIDDHKRHKDDNLRVLCQEVLELLKGVVGLESFTQTYADVQRSRQDKRLHRKRQMALEAVADPEGAARKKIKKNLSKRDAKKRKIKAKRPTYMLSKKMKFTS